MTTYWKKGKPAKSAKFEFKNGDQLIGNWEDGSLFNKLTYTLQSGVTITGDLSTIESELFKKDIKPNSLRQNIALVYYAIAMEYKMAKNYKKASEMIDQAQSKLLAQDSLFQIIENHKQNANPLIQIN